MKRFRHPPAAGHHAVPYLVLADIFTCALSMIFVLLLLTDPERVLAEHPSRADYRLLCRDGALSLFDRTGTLAGGPVPLAAAATLPAGLDLHDRLSVRFLIQGGPGETRCLTGVAAALAELNRTLSLRLVAGGEGAYLLYDTELLPPGSDGGTGP